MFFTILARAFAGTVAVLSIAVLVYVYSFPPQSTRVTREGVPLFTPPVVNPATGAPVRVDELVRHFKGS